MKKPLDLSGQRHGRLIPREIVGKSDTGKVRWLCQCDCGTETVASANCLRRGRVKSCGCLRKEVSASAQLTHGESVRSAPETPEYRTWKAMKTRCLNSQQPGYKNYGGRGITVCESWMGSFDAFLADMGRKPTPQHSIERIDNEEGYYPANCKWATRSEQNGNTRNSLKNRNAA